MTTNKSESTPSFLGYTISYGPSGIDGYPFSANVYKNGEFVTGFMHKTNEGVKQMALRFMTNQEYKDLEELYRAGKARLVVNHINHREFETDEYRYHAGYSSEGTEGGVLGWCVYKREPLTSKQFEEHDTVCLTGRFNLEGEIFATGTEGAIVHIHADASGRHIAYEVELFSNEYFKLGENNEWLPATAEDDGSFPRTLAVVTVYPYQIELVT